MNSLTNIKVGEKINTQLVVLEAAERKTRANKPYIACRLSDGTTNIAGNYWDWPEDSGVPQRGLVYDVTATVGDWQGVPQLNIMKMSINTEANIADFIPSSDIDIEAVYNEAMQIAESITDDFLYKIVSGILYELKHLWLTVPGAKSIHHAYKAGTLIHSVSVAHIAKSIAANIPEANNSLVIAGALLHDLGKLYTYGFDGAAIDYTDEGQLFEHAFMGAEFIGNYAEDKCGTIEHERKIGLLRHIILSHHATLEFGAVVTPRCLEAYIVHHADAVDAAAEQIRVAAKAIDNKPWTDKIWAMNNTPHLNPSYISKIFSSDTQTKETV